MIKFVSIKLKLALKFYYSLKVLKTLLLIRLISIKSSW